MDWLKRGALVSPSVQALAQQVKPSIDSVAGTFAYEMGQDSWFRHAVTPHVFCDLACPTGMAASDRPGAFFQTSRLKSVGNPAGFLPTITRKGVHRSLQMKSPKALTSAIVAVALAGGIGLAYAQTSDSTMGNNPTMQNQGAGSGAAAGGNAAMNPAPGADSGNTAPSMGTSMQTERPAQADRN